MGAYTDQLKPKPFAGEHLVAAAIVRDGTIHSNGARAHYEIRHQLGDDNCSQSNPDDVEGFLSSTGRFLTRREAMVIGERAGQCRPMVRDLLSSDIRWTP